MYKYISFEDDFDEPVTSYFNESKKIDYYKIYSISSNTCTFILTHQNEIQRAINKNKNLLMHLFLREN